MSKLKGNISRTPERIDLTCAIILVVVAVVGGFIMLIRTHTIVSEEDSRGENHLLRMIAGTEQLDNSDLGNLAGVARELNASRNPADAYLTYFIRPNQFGDAQVQMQTRIFDPDVKDLSRFDQDFIVKAMQVSNPADLPKATFNEPLDTEWDWLSWFNYIVILVGILTLWLAAVLVYHLSSWLARKWRNHRLEESEEQKQKAFYDSLPIEGQEAYNILQQLKATPNPDFKTSDLIAQTEAFVNRTAKGYDDPLADVIERLDELKAKFTAISEYVQTAP